MYFGTPVFWRETHKQPRFLIFDGRLVLVLFLTIMHLRLWTIALSLATIGILWFFDRKGVSADSILRFLRARLVGRRRTARGLHNERPAVEYGFETEAHVDRARQTIELRAKADEKAKAKAQANKTSGKA
ncbi:IcmT/TraK family protein [Epibacterium sp. DP7N7-1]|nr:IcmT/TraK family protein [Epibacterium sp. DP7N7-1]